MTATMTATDDNTESALRYAILCIDRNTHDLEQTWIMMDKSGLTDPQIMNEVEDAINFSRQSRSIMNQIYKDLSGEDYG